MKWQDRRAILLSLCENITDEDILANNEQFAPLSAELKGRTVQEFKKIVQSKQSAINDNLKAIPGRISEANLAIPENVANVDESEKASIEKKIADLNDEINNIKNGSGENKIKAEIQNMKNEIASIKAERCDVAELESELNTKRSELFTINHNKSGLEQKISTADFNIKHCEDMANKFRQMWHEVNSRQYTGNGICPTCGQAFPEEQIESAKAKFNIERAEELDKITANGKSATASAGTEKRLRSKLVAELEEVKTKAETCEAEIENLIAKIEKTKAEHKANQEKRIADILIRIAEAENKAENGTEDIQSKIYPIEEQITAEKAKLDEINKAILSHELAEKQKQRIAELEADEKRLAGEYAELDKMSFLIDEFIKYMDYENLNILPEQVLQYSSFEHGVITLCKHLYFCNPSTYNELGEKLIHAQLTCANKKYGENHSKLAQELSFVRLTREGSVKVYITNLGKSRIKEFKNDWKEIITIYNFVCKEEEDE